MLEPTQRHINTRHSRIPAVGRKVQGQALVLDGNTVKLRLQAERTEHQTPVHVDWVRFTCFLRNAQFPAVDRLFATPDNDAAGIPLADWSYMPDRYMPEQYRMNQINLILRGIPDEDYLPATQALELAEEIAQALGPDFAVHPEIRKGMDFYKHRWSIERQGAECGWVGFLSSSDSPSKQAQNSTLHANVFGSACTFAVPGWNDRLADICEEREGKLTRVDLALDFFDGLSGGLDKIVNDYNAGLLDSGGKRLVCNMVGDWSNNPRDGRSFYTGSKEAGKQTNYYEKGHQLFGFAAGSQWLRAELRLGNKLRVLDVDILRRPADFFAGASDYHAELLRVADAVVVPEPIKTKARLAVETIEAEVSRALRWANQTAGASLAMFTKYATFEQLRLVTEARALPKRMQKFKGHEIAEAFEKAFSLVTTPQSCPALTTA